MSRQIQIAQALADETAMCLAVTKRFSLLCLPRFMSAPNMNPLEACQCDAQDQILFGKQFEAIVQQHIVPVVSKK